MVQLMSRIWLYYKAKFLEFYKKAISWTIGNWKDSSKSF